MRTTETYRRIPAEWNAPTNDGCHLLEYNGFARDYARNFGLELCQQKFQQKCQQRRLR